MKKTIAMTCALSLLLGLTACGGKAEATPTPTEAETLYTAGTYPVTVSGHNGDIKLEVTFSDDAITEVKVVEHGETPMISDKAISDVPKAIVDGQTLAVEAISGATVTSKAILSGVEEAVKAAGGDVSALQSVVDKSDEKAGEETLSADVVVVGAGAAGLIAANCLAEQGHHVILMEKMSYPGGATNTCGGGVFVSGTQEQKELNDHPDSNTLYTMYMRMSNGTCDPAVCQLFADNMPLTIDYLKSIGLPVIRATESRYITPEAGVYEVEGGGAGLIKYMEDKIKTNENVDYYLSTKVTELRTDADGAVVGVKAVGDKGTAYTVDAQAVVLATGSYTGNEELIGQALFPEVINTSVNYMDGDGLLMAQAVGAKVDHLDWTNPMGCGIATSEHDGVYFSNQGKIAAATGSIVVNKSGERIMNEESNITDQVPIYEAQEGGCVYFVMDQAGFDMFHSSGVTFHTFFTADEVDRWLEEDSVYPLLVTGDTIEEAGNAAGIDGAALQATVERYNEMVAAGEDTEFGRTLSTPLEGPVYILQMFARVSKTSGGLSCNDQLQILDTEGAPIPGLYGAGEVNSSSALGSSTDGFLSWCVTSGKYVSEVLDGILK